ncbi:MAG TPA: hypothetical protein VMR66_00630 [Gemmatimonadota bacterium]|nr:hypothetical protein [Gemmatimonadota bacterium]
MTTRIFLHSPSEAPNALDIAVRMPEFECLGERALLLARPGDVVCLARPVDARHVAFLRSLGIGPRPEDILVFDGIRPGTGLSARIATDGPSLDRLACRLRKTEALELVPFFATPATATLGRFLRSRLGRPVRVAGGPASLVRRLHEKSAGRALARSLGVPVAPGDVVRIPRGAGRADLAGLRRAVLHRSRPTGRAVLRGSSGASGSSTFVVEPDRLDEVLEAVVGRPGDRLWLVEPLYESLVSPNVEVVVERGDPGGLRLGITDQLLDRDLAYLGSVHPSRARRQDRMLEDARTMAAWMRRKAFRGRVGFDFVEHEHHGRVRHFLAEINPRVNGASYPHALTARLVRLAGRLGGPAPKAFLSRTVPVATRDYAELERHLGDRLYDPRRGEGIVPWSPSALEAGKIGVACLAGTRSRATELLDALSSLAGANGVPAPVP